MDDQNKKETPPISDNKGWEYNPLLGHQLHENCIARDNDITNYFLNDVKFFRFTSVEKGVIKEHRCYVPGL